MTTFQIVFVMLLAYQAKHFLADFPLQRRFMLGKFNDDWSFFLPLLAHVAVHAAGTFLITCWFGIGKAMIYAAIDAFIHFFMDRFKASKKYLGRFKSLNSSNVATATFEQWKQNDYFWWSVGLDQMVHHLTHYAIIYAVISQQ